MQELTAEPALTPGLGHGPARPWPSLLSEGVAQGLALKSLSNTDDSPGSPSSGSVDVMLSPGTETQESPRACVTVWPSQCTCLCPWTVTVTVCAGGAFEVQFTGMEGDWRSASFCDL